MATPEFHNGSDGRAFVKPPGASTSIELEVHKWDLSIKSNSKDVSNAVSGRKRIAGVVDASGNVSMHWDSANEATDATTGTGPNVRAGSILLLELVPDGSPSGTSGFRLSVIVEEVKTSSDFEGTVDYEVSYNLEDGSSLKYPGDA
ncbi:hypothetical protein [Singulisphaera sp. PoT]|uniref:hypothetical protein n=1 Tax=Singulisphaera sp. PoT TaxID=3411797 RepID=UPI003BF47428